MRQVHRAGEKLFVDYAGHTSAVDRAIDYLVENARRRHPDRNRIRGRLKLDLHHVALGA